MFLFSEVDTSDLDNNQVVVAIYNGEAIIIVGENSPVEQVEYAVMVQGILNDLNVNSEIILSNQIVGPNLIDLFVEGVMELPTEPEDDNDYNTDCKLEGEIANPSLGPVHGSVCCEGLSYHPLYHMPAVNGVQPMMAGAPSFCYDEDEGEPECYYSSMESEKEEGWYYPDGDLILTYPCFSERPRDPNNNVPTIVNIPQSRLINAFAYEKICEEYGWKWNDDSNTCYGMTNDLCKKYNGVRNPSECTEDSSGLVVCTESSPYCTFRGNIVVGEIEVMSSQGKLEAHEIEVTDKELKQFQNEYGVELRFLKLQEALLKYMGGQKRIISHIEENHPDVDTTILHEITEGKMADLLERVKSIDYNSDQDFTALYAEIKTNAKDLVALFGETARELIPEVDVLALRHQIKPVDTEETIVLQKQAREKVQKYNSEEVKRILSHIGVEDSKLVEAVESGVANYGSIRSAVAQKIKVLDNDEKKEINLRMREAKAKSEVQKDVIMQKLRQTNWSAVKERVRVAITSSNAASTGSRQANSAQGVNN